MRKLFPLVPIFFAATMTGTMTGCAQISLHPDDTPKSCNLGSTYLADLAEKQMMPATVSIKQKTAPAPVNGFQKESLGSGFIIDGKQGYIITNYHVIDADGAITVALPNGKTFDTTVVGKDSATDLAVLKIEPEQVLPQVSFGNSDELRPGMSVVAVGNPQGLANTVTTGIVSGLHRPAHNPVYNDFIQTDVAINPGNSGGPLFNMYGEVVGVNSQILSSTGYFSGISFAIPSNQAERIAQELIDHGRVRRGYVGVVFQEVTHEKSDFVDLLIKNILPDGPAALAGFQKNDVISMLDGKTFKSSADFMRHVINASIGSKLDVIFWRDGKEKHTKLIVQEKPSEDALAKTMGASKTPQTPPPDMMPGMMP